MTLVELSLYLEGFYRRMRRNEESNVATGWWSANLSRAKRLPSLKQLLKPKTARVLSADEAKAEKAKHEDRIKRMAPDATATEDQLKAFVAQQNKEFAEKHKAPARGN